MIFNRTSEDVQNAYQIRLKLGSGEELTESEYVTLERGTLTINSLNRIENKQAELENYFNENFYFSEKLKLKTWNFDDIFDETELPRIIENIEILKNAFYVFLDTPKTPIPAYHYQNINDIEKILFDLEEMLNDMINRYRECGTFECGEENEL
jgi:hypothetical protein